ncbi:hypothetical protein TNCV_5022961 [Trichonephila clavipes]|nr:hypothetical protein TNCV_5022961 [Trichonephila clavipes]
MELAGATAIGLLFEKTHFYLKSLPESPGDHLNSFAISELGLSERPALSVYAGARDFAWRLLTTQAPSLMLYRL